MALDENMNFPPLASVPFRSVSTVRFDPSEPRPVRSKQVRYFGHFEAAINAKSGQPPLRSPEAVERSPEAVEDTAYCCSRYQVNMVAGDGGDGSS
ncbi:hypothetical protein CRG98_019298 [Punica granatum]|uniref:Uncharacterized protein n=1 Tax=Punica granatum TaxID=22663 RepID=A0A2I0JVT1_PUNGR|nr:hypothetical protein CRG98_019298 [Punica granatum]